MLSLPAWAYPPGWLKQPEKGRTVSLSQVDLEALLEQPEKIACLSLTLMHSPIQLVGTHLHWPGGLDCR